jgi:mannose-6-phosphate isomerase-like protein (cupin superfamily)
MQKIQVRTDWGFWIVNNFNILAGVVRADFSPPGPNFVTEPDSNLQVAVMNRPRGYKIESHEHLEVHRTISSTQEVLIIQSGSLRADLFHPGTEYFGSVLVHKGDILILTSGGHGFEASEDCVFIEVKQGPYSPDNDKKVFSNTVGSDTPIRLIE